MALYTDIIDPADLTEFARAHQEALNTERDTLADFLPDKTTVGIDVRFNTGVAGLIEEARWRAYDGEIEIGRGASGARRIMELPAVGQKVPVTEYEQLINRDDEDVLRGIEDTTLAVVNAVDDAIERLRGNVLATGRVTIDQSNYGIDESFGRDERLTTTAPVLFTDPEADVFGYIESLVDLWSEVNGGEPGVALVSNQVARAIQRSSGLSLISANGDTRHPSLVDINAMLEANGLPTLRVYKRRTSQGPIIPQDTMILLPEPDANPDTNPLGATYWGETLTSRDASYGIPSGDRAGITTGVYRNEEPPMILEVIAEAHAAPVLRNANLSLAAKVI